MDEVNPYSNIINEKFCQILYDNEFFKSEQKFLVKIRSDGLYSILDDVGSDLGSEFSDSLKLDFLVEQLFDPSRRIACQNIVEGFDFIGTLDSCSEGCFFSGFRPKANEFKSFSYWEKYKYTHMEALDNMFLRPWLKSLDEVII